MKKNLKYVIFGLIFALCLSFSILGFSYLGVNVNAVEGENIEPPKTEEVTPTITEKKFTKEEIEEGVNHKGILTLKSDNTFFIELIEDGNNVMSVSGQYEYDKVSNCYDLIVGGDLIESVVIDETNMTWDFYYMPEPPIELPEEKPQEVPKEEDKKGFLERNFDILISNFLGNGTMIAALLAFIIKANKTVKGAVNSLANQVEMSEGSVKKIQKLNEVIDKSNANLEKAIEVFNDKTKDIEEKLTVIFSENKDQLNDLFLSFEKLTKAIVYLAEHSYGNVESGVAEEINKIIDGVDTNEEGKK